MSGEPFLRFVEQFCRYRALAQHGPHFFALRPNFEKTPRWRMANAQAAVGQLAIGFVISRPAGHVDIDHDPSLVTRDAAYRRPARASRTGDEARAGCEGALSSPACLKSRAVRSRKTASMFGRFRETAVFTNPSRVP